MAVAQALGDPSYHSAPMRAFLSACLLWSVSIATSACSQSTDCADGDCVCMGTCACLPGDELTMDTIDAQPLYTVDGIPVVVVRLDLAGQCLGEGARTYVVYRTTSLEISTGPVDVDDFRTPRHVPDSFAYEYMDLSIEVRDIAGPGVSLAFVDPSGTNETLMAECVETGGVLSCTQL